MKSTKRDQQGLLLLYFIITLKCIFHDGGLEGKCHHDEQSSILCITGSVECSRELYICETQLRYGICRES